MWSLVGSKKILTWVNRMRYFKRTEKLAKFLSYKPRLACRRYPLGFGDPCCHPLVVEAAGYHCRPPRSWRMETMRRGFLGRLSSCDRLIRWEGRWPLIHRLSGGLPPLTMPWRSLSTCWCGCWIPCVKGRTGICPFPSRPIRFVHQKGPCRRGGWLWSH